MHVGIAAVDGAFSSGLAAALDILRTADLLRDRVDESLAPVTFSVHASTLTVQTPTGLSVDADGPLDELSKADVVLVGGIGLFDASALLEALDSPGARRLVEALETLEPGTPVAAACTGTFLLAEAGLLRQRRATTTWWLGAAFRDRYPHTKLDMDAMVVADGPVTTAGAAFGHVDLVLDMLLPVSATLADVVARYLLIDRRPAQSAYAAIGYLSAQDELVAAFERHVRSQLDRPANVQDMAEAIGTSVRTLERRVRASVGLSPLAMVRRIRAEHARHLLTTTDMSTDEVARRVGYLNASTLRALLRQEKTRSGHP